MSQNKTRKSSTKKIKPNKLSMRGGAYGAFTRYGPGYPTRYDPRIPKGISPENIEEYREFLAEQDEKDLRAAAAHKKSVNTKFKARVSLAKQSVPSLFSPTVMRSSAGDKVGAEVQPSRSSASQESRWAAQAAALLEPPNGMAVRIENLNDETTLSELERRVKTCELLLLHMNRVFSTRNKGLFDNDEYRLSPQFIDDFVFIPNKDGETLLGQIRHNYHPVTREDRISIYGSPYYIPSLPHGAKMDPDDIQFLNKRKVKNIYPGVISEPSDPDAIETEVITYGDITSTLFETRLQIREYNQRPKNNQGKTLNFSIQQPFTAEYQYLNRGF